MKIMKVSGFDLGDFKVSDRWPNIAEQMVVPENAQAFLKKLWNVLAIFSYSNVHFNIEILSGYRDEKLLTAFQIAGIPASPTSQHPAGQAVDFTLTPRGDSTPFTQSDAVHSAFFWLYLHRDALSRDFNLGQVILETHGDPPWVHLATDSPKGMRFEIQNEDKKSYSLFTGTFA